MDELRLLCTALGLAALAGINLYLTVFVLSLSLNTGWLVLGPEYASLQVVGHPAILISSGIMYVLEFFADKVPWVDTLWDVLHTLVRPLGAAFLGMAILGQTNSVAEILAALACGGVALSTHLTKAGTRLVVNTSPEPITNSVVSLTEDLIVVGGMAFVYKYPLTSGLLVLLAVTIFIFLAPKIFRLIRALFTFTFALLRSWFSGAGEEGLTVEMSDAERDRLPELTRANDRVLWALPGLAGSTSGGPLLHRGHLLAIGGPDARIGWVGRKREPRWLSLNEAKLQYKRRFLYHELEFSDSAHKIHFRVRLGKDQKSRVDAILQEFKQVGDQSIPGSELALA